MQTKKENTNPMTKMRLLLDDEDLGKILSSPRTLRKELTFVIFDIVLVARISQIATGL